MWGNSELPVPTAKLVWDFYQRSQGAKGLDTEVLVV